MSRKNPVSPENALALAIEHLDDAKDLVVKAKGAIRQFEEFEDAPREVHEDLKDLIDTIEHAVGIIEEL